MQHVNRARGRFQFGSRSDKRQQMNGPPLLPLQRFPVVRREGKIAIEYVDTNLNPADFFTTKLKSTKCDSYIDTISGNASTIPGAESSLPATLKTRMFSPPLLANHIAHRVHQGSQDSMPNSTQDDSRVEGGIPEGILP